MTVDTTSERIYSPRHPQRESYSWQHGFPARGDTSQPPLQLSGHVTTFSLTELSSNTLDVLLPCSLLPLSRVRALVVHDPASIVQIRCPRGSGSGKESWAPVGLHGAEPFHQPKPLLFQEWEMNVYTVERNDHNPVVRGSLLCACSPGFSPVGQHICPAPGTVLIKVSMHYPTSFS